MVAITVEKEPATGAFTENDFLPIPDKTLFPSTDQVIKTLSKLLA